MTGTVAAGYGIRAARASDLLLLPAIERDAAEMFRSIGRWNP